MNLLIVKDAIQTIHQSLDQIIQTVSELPEDVLRWNPTEEEWSVMQILCHLAEAIPYWLDEIEHLLATPGEEWGRGLQDPHRLAAVDKQYVDNTTRLTVLTQLAELKPLVEQTLNKLDEETLTMKAPSRNPRFGTKPVAFIVDHLLVEHISKHEGQIQRNLSKTNHK